MKVSLWILFCALSIAFGSGATQEYARKPVWTHMGRDAANRQVWIRLDQEGDDVKIAIFAGGKLVKSKEVDAAGWLSSADITTVVLMGRNWMLFFDTFTMDSDYTQYLLIDRQSFAFTAYGNFEISDPRRFQVTRQLVEYRYLKYEFGEPYRLHFYRRAGAFGYLRQVWHWDARRARFRPVGHTLVQLPPKSFRERWSHESGEPWN